MTRWKKSNFLLMECPVCNETIRSAALRWRSQWASSTRSLQTAGSGPSVTTQARPDDTVALASSSPPTCRLPAHPQEMNWDKEGQGLAQRGSECEEVPGAGRKSEHPEKVPPDSILHRKSDAAPGKKRKYESPESRAETPLVPPLTSREAPSTSSLSPWGRSSLSDLQQQLK